MKKGIGNQGKIRIKDIAERANVSTGTVDRVLHKRGEVKKETKEKVLAIVEEMGYTPNLLAKVLSSKKTYSIAAVIPDASDNNPYWEKPRNGILKGAAELHDYNTKVDIYTFNATDESSFIKVIGEVLANNPAGVIFNPLFRDASLEFAKTMDSGKIPYVYIDTDLEHDGNLAYFGQNAKQSGKVAAKIMSSTLSDDSKILIVKLANHKVITSHLRKRESGFLEFFKESNKCNCKFVSVEIDLSNALEPSLTLGKVFNENPDIKGVFVPSSRVFRVVEYLQQAKIPTTTVIGFDLIWQNVKLLENNAIDFLVSQKPEDQGYNSVMAVFNHVVSGKAITKVNHSAIDIIIKENIEFYNRD